MSATRNARFWFWWNGSFVKLTLRPEQTLRFHTSKPTDEGFSYEINEFTHEVDRVLLRWESGGRDCDGTTTQAGKSAADLDKLAVTSHEEHGIKTPDWQAAGRTRVYDQFAQAAGY